MAKNTHLTLEERFLIARHLDNRDPFKAIGASLDRDCTTISKEVRAHKIYKKTGAPGRAFNNCARRRGCDHRRICTSCTSNRYCWSCKKCTAVCPDFIEERCGRLSRAPYVCNGCPDLKKCTLEKCFYQPAYADKEYRTMLRESREGISLSEDEVRHLDSIISPLIRKGQSIHHICVHNKDSVMVSESTVYRFVDYNIFSARNIDLPRKIRYSRRRVKKHVKVDKKCRVGRTYQDLQHYLAGHPDLPIVEIDTVEGTKGGKVLLTLHFVKAEFMLAFLRSSNDSQSVIDVFEKLYRKLGCTEFQKLMPLLLADNGSEFSNPSAIEYSCQGDQRTRVFYCDPSAPHQKGSAERNHEFIRNFVPKGTSFEPYTQRDINRMMDNINSYGRQSLSDRSPWDMMAFLYGEDILKLLGSHKIRPNDVVMNASVFRRKADSNDKS